MQIARLALGIHRLQISRVGEEGIIEQNRGPLGFSCGVIYPMGLIDCDGQLEDDTTELGRERKFISAACQLVDGILDDVIFNVMAGILIAKQGGASVFTVLSLVMSAIAL